MSKYFTIKELCGSSVARQRSIQNYPPTGVEANLTELIDNVLDPLRRMWGRPITVNSGYRCPELNRAVGGAAASQHLTGEAADITTGSKDSNMRLFEMAAKSSLPFDQLIDESGYSWIHISYSPRHRRQILHL